MDRFSLSELKKCTEDLLNLNKEAELFYTNVARSEGYEPDFFGKVKPFAEEVEAVRSRWLPLAYEFVRSAKPLHLHPSQIQQTEENLEVVAIKSFYGNSSLKIQMETFKAVHYTLELLIEALRQEE